MSMTTLPLALTKPQREKRTPRRFLDEPFTYRIQRVCAPVEDTHAHDEVLQVPKARWPRSRRNPRRKARSSQPPRENAGKKKTEGQNKRRARRAHERQKRFLPVVPQEHDHPPSPESDVTSNSSASSDTPTLPLHSLFFSSRQYVYNPNHPVGRDVDPHTMQVECMRQRLLRINELGHILSNRNVTPDYVDEVSAFDFNDPSCPVYYNCLRLKEKIARGHGLRRLWRLFAEHEHLYRWIEMTPEISTRFVSYVNNMQQELHTLITHVGNTLWSLPHGMFTSLDTLFKIDHVWGTCAIERTNANFTSLLSADAPYQAPPQRAQHTHHTHLVLVQPHMSGDMLHDIVRACAGPIRVILAIPDTCDDWKTLASQHVSQGHGWKMCYLKENQMLPLSRWVHRPPDRGGRRKCNLRGALRMHWYILHFGSASLQPHIPIDEYATTLKAWTEEWGGRWNFPPTPPHEEMCQDKYIPRHVGYTAGPTQTPVC